MRIGVALFQFFPGQVGGAGEYIERLIPGLIQVMGPGDELVLFGNPDNLEPFTRFEGRQLKLVTFPWSRRWIQLLRLADLVLPMSPSRLFSGAINRHQIDVLLCPQQSIFPRGIRSPSVVTVMDLLHYRCPDQVSPFQRWLRKRKERHLVQNCAHTISISRATRSDLQEFYSIPPEKCSVVYLGGNGGISSNIAPNPLPEGSPYVFYPANSYPHKNHLKLLQAFRYFRKAKPGIAARLVLSGQCSSALRSLIETEYKKFDVLHVGYVSREEVAALYRDCRAIVIPSGFEGFGMPLIEGLGHARPVFCSNLTVFQELAGTAVEYFNPDSESSFASLFARIFESEPQPPDPLQVSEILRRLNWDRCAAETYAILRNSFRPSIKTISNGNAVHQS